MNRCKTCKWWEVRAFYPEYAKRLCRNENLGGISMELSSNASRLDASSGVETGPEFGCVHHKEKGGQ